MILYNYHILIISWKHKNFHDNLCLHNTCSCQQKSNVLIRLWECEIFADNAIYKRHFVDANSVHWLDPTHNVFGLGLTTYISWMRKKKGPERKVLLMNCNKKRNPEFSKGKKDMNEINWIWSLFQCLEECEELYY